MNNTSHKQLSTETGSIIVSILVISIFLSSFVYSLIVLSASNLTRARGRVLLLQAQYAAESGSDTAVALFNSGNLTYPGTGGLETVVLTNAQYKSTFKVNVIAGANAKEKIVTAVGKVYAPANATTANYSRTITVVVQRSSTTTSSALLSRNIIDIDSGVKNLEAKEIYVNGYIRLNKNTTNLIAESIIVAGKYTGASNCSIVGTGTLVKPSVFTIPSQTKTNITVAYNNCISPPGNSSNANFNVLSGQTGIGKVQSTNIPWSQYMDTSYQDAAGGCSDWTTGSFPRDIPSTGNIKKTHYPDSSSNISTLCGSSGNLDLATGQYNIKDHVHLRANLCGTTGCTPTFNNPDATLKYVFVEGTINLNSVQTANGSGPIVLVSYGTDMPSKASVCPTGAAIYLGNSSTTFAPQIFFLALNGVCLDKTKFTGGVGSSALGGMSGKNLYIASSPATPKDLKLDPTFPTNQIPIDLSWRAVRFRRL